MKKLFILTLLPLVFISCETEEDEFAPLAKLPFEEDIVTDNDKDDDAPITLTYDDLMGEWEYHHLDSATCGNATVQEGSVVTFEVKDTSNNTFIYDDTYIGRYSEMNGGTYEVYFGVTQTLQDTTMLLAKGYYDSEKELLVYDTGGCLIYHSKK